MKSMILRNFCVLLFILLIVSGCNQSKDIEKNNKWPLVFSADFENGNLDNWQPTDEKAWRIADCNGNHVLSLFKRSQYRPTVRSPFNINLIKDLEFGSFAMELKMLSTKKDYAHRDMCIFFGYQDPCHFYYVHIANQSDAVANTILVVDGNDRESIAKTRTAGTKWDDNWHTVKILRDINDGRIEVYFDNHEKPIMTAVDKRFKWGKIGVGSFDDTGCFDDIRIWAEKNANNLETNPIRVPID